MAMSISDLDFPGRKRDRLELLRSREPDHRDRAARLDNTVFDYLDSKPGQHRFAGVVSEQPGFVCLLGGICRYDRLGRRPEVGYDGSRVGYSDGQDHRARDTANGYEPPDAEF